MRILKVHYWDQVFWILFCFSFALAHVRNRTGKEGLSEAAPVSLDSRWKNRLSSLPSADSFHHSQKEKEISSRRQGGVTTKAKPSLEFSNVGKLIISSEEYILKPLFTHRLSMEKMAQQDTTGYVW